MSLVLLLISWVTLFLFTCDILGSAVASARTAGVYFGLSAVRMAAVLLLVGSTLDGLLPAICLTEIVAVSVGMTYLHSLDKRKGVVCGLTISVAVIAFLIAVIAFAGP